MVCTEIFLFECILLYNIYVYICVCMYWILIANIVFEIEEVSVGLVSDDDMVCL